jgi:hypothetical protein
MRRFLLFQAVFYGIINLFALTGSVGAGNGPAADAAFSRLKAEFPMVAKFEKGSHLSRVYGRSFGSGSDPEQTARQFVNEYSALFGALAEDLYPVTMLSDGLHSRQLMYNRDTGEYKFTLVYYSQFRNGYPVFRADLRLLVLNAPDFPLVLASSGLRNLGDFIAPAGLSGDASLAENAARSFYPGLINFSQPRLVIWAGMEDMIVSPTLAIEIVADNDKPATDDFERWLFLIDAATGEILYTEDMILHTNIAGNVSGNATVGWAADICDTTAVTPMPYARVYVEGEGYFFADENGDFEIMHDGNSPVTVFSHMRGRWFRVFNYSGPNAEISMEVTPPGPADFLHNADDDNEYTRAEVNGYYHANVVRDFTLNYHPTYPVIYQQQEFAVNVNLDENCNAFYDGYSINFFTSGGGCANTAFSTVVHHEYGHHLVNVGGSGQGAYGEGMSDVMGILISDDPALAWGFSGNCSQYMRTGDNDFQYPCSGPIHYCGQLLSGCVWSTRNALLENYPDTYMDILSGIAINAVVLHRGTDIDPSITIDYLSVDDDDGDIWNGTPHGLEIVQGFVHEHSMDPGITVQIYHTPLVDTEDSTAVLTVSANVVSFFSMEGGSVTTYYSFDDEFTEIEMENTSGDVWECVIPNPPYETTVSYYIEAIDGAGQMSTSPENAPDSVYSFYFGTDVIPPTLELLEFPPNTVNLFGPYGPFIITAWDVHGVDESDVLLHYRVNDEEEGTINLAPTGNDNEFSLDLLDLDRQLNSGDIVYCYFTAFDEANTPNMGRLPESGDFELVMANYEIFEEFEEYGIDRWFVEGSWNWREPGYNGGHSLSFGPSYPNNADDMAYMEFGYDLSPYDEARICLMHRNALIGDTCFVLATGDGGSSWSTVGFITGYPGNSFVYDEYDISPVLDPDNHDHRVGFRFISDSNQNAGILFLDNIGWVVGPVTDIDTEQTAAVPERFSLSQNYPNPFNPATNIYMELPSNSNVRLEIYDIMGRKVTTLIDEDMNAGGYTIRWDGRDSHGNQASSGIYFYRLSTDFGVRQAKMTLLK